MKAAAAILASALLVGCGHATSTEQGSSAAGPKQAEPPAHPKRLPAGGGGESGLVTTTPAGLLVPGAEAQIREHLAAKGFLGHGHDVELTEGLRRFQAENDLPATGVPDHETVRKLGLDPEKIFRRSAEGHP